MDSSLITEMKMHQLSDTPIHTTSPTLALVMSVLLEPKNAMASWLHGL